MKASHGIVAVLCIVLAVSIAHASLDVNLQVGEPRAPQVPNEADTADNFYIDDIVKLVIPGDINGDGSVDIFDLVIVTGVYGTSPGDDDWNPDADINGDDIVDIFDLVIVASHYGEHT